MLGAVNEKRPWDFSVSFLKKKLLKKWNLGADSSDNPSSKRLHVRYAVTTWRAVSFQSFAY